ncbi:tumor necrosis factor receptor superfamily member 14-like isoform X2 [Trematomus bernacchii]|uniref:tumor necrosis factor receptor superfamily member 14-like isoform X2 n=1 Tax=Trematomus bernacchii TaxID=40690 RepID=UPI00146B758C|nr:tumor necrosis factor receptor superfamily member 14-like isoform X2 [Trematomus bernacchii]
MLAVFVFLGCAYFVAPVFQLSCLSKEYVSKAGCCPMCRKGTIVQEDCSYVAGTLCSRCEKGTYMNQPNGLNRCFTCTSCDSGHGLFVLQGCSETTDTVCEVIDGYFCKDVTGCSAAQKHTTCVPGERIKEPGTSREDAQCELCQPGFFSKHGVNCNDWITCSETQVKLKEGTESSDVVCGVSSRNHYIVIPAVILFEMTIVALFMRGHLLESNANEQDGRIQSLESMCAKQSWV